MLSFSEPAYCKSKKDSERLRFSLACKLEEAATAIEPAVRAFEIDLEKLRDIPGGESSLATRASGMASLLRAKAREKELRLQVAMLNAKSEHWKGVAMSRMSIRKKQSCGASSSTTPFRSS